MATAAPDRTLRATDLTPRDWLEAGQSLLRRGGLRALKLRRLATELNVSTGSFYHHFTDFDAYQGRLGGLFRGRASCQHPRHDHERGAKSRRSHPPARRDRPPAGGCSVSHSRCAPGPKAITVRRLRSNGTTRRSSPSCRIASRANGLTPYQARVRGYALMTLGLGKVHAPDLDRPALMEELIALLCTPTDATVETGRAGGESMADQGFDYLIVIGGGSAGCVMGGAPVRRPRSPRAADRSRVATIETCSSACRPASAN